MGTHCNVHGLQIWAYKKYLKKKIKGFFFVLKEKAENFLNQLAIKSNGQFTEDILETVSTS